MKMRWMGVFCAVVGVVVLSIQWFLISQLRRETNSLRAQLESATQPSDPVAAPASYPAAPQANVNEAELQRLRDEVRQLQMALASMRSTAVASQAATPTAPAQGIEDEIRQLGLAASQGDFTALDKLAELSAAARTNGNPNTLAQIRLAFSLIAGEAGKGSETAFNALWRATRMKYLEGIAVHGLGEAAAAGNEKALEPLLDPERYLLLQSSCVGALAPAAEKGNERAIQGLAAVANQPKNKALWYMVASGLEKPAAAGNATAIDGLATLARSDNQNVRKAALRALENAAFNQHAKAADALRSLGYQ